MPDRRDKTHTLRAVPLTEEGGGTETAAGKEEGMEGEKERERQRIK